MRLLIVLCLGCAFLSGGQLNAREWKNKQGKLLAEAELVGVKNGKATLQKADGKVLTLPLAKFSDADREYIESQEASDAKDPDAPAKVGKPAKAAAKKKAAGAAPSSKNFTVDPAAAKKFYDALFFGRDEEVKELAAKTPDLLKAGIFNTQPGIYQFALSNKPDTVKLLLDLGAPVNLKAYYGETPLHGAAWAKSPEIVQILADQGADVNAKDDNGDTPLDHLQKSNDPRDDKGETKKLLLKLGAKPGRGK